MGSRPFLLFPVVRSDVGPSSATAHSQPSQIAACTLFPSSSSTSLTSSPLLNAFSISLTSSLYSTSQAPAAKPRPKWLAFRLVRWLKTMKMTTKPFTLPLMSPSQLHLMTASLTWTMSLLRKVSVPPVQLNMVRLTIFRQSWSWQTRPGVGAPNSKADRYSPPVHTADRCRYQRACTTRQHCCWVFPKWSPPRDR